LRVNFLRRANCRSKLHRPSRDFGDHLFQRGQHSHCVQIIVVTNVSDAKKLSLQVCISVGHDRAKLLAEAFANGGGVSSSGRNDGRKRPPENSARIISVRALQRRRGSLPRTTPRLQSVRRVPLQGSHLPFDAHNRALRPARQTKKSRACMPSPPWRLPFVPSADRSNIAEISFSPCAATPAR